MPAVQRWVGSIHGLSWVGSGLKFRSSSELGPDYKFKFCFQLIFVKRGRESAHFMHSTAIPSRLCILIIQGGPKKRGHRLTTKNVIVSSYTFFVF